MKRSTSLLIHSSNMTASAPPTTVRWRIVALLMATAAMCHFNRISVSVAGSERIIPELGIRPETMGVVYSAYLIAYTLFMTPGGWLIDRAGARMALLLMGFGAALAVTMTGVVGLLLPAGSLVAGLIVIRALAGVVHAPIHPGAARCVATWVPLPQQALANGLVTSAALVGIAGTYPLFGGLIDRFGWPRSFLVAGAATGLVAAIWALYSRQRPSEHPGVNDAERDLIAANTFDAHGMPATGREPWAHLLRDRSLLLLTASYAAVGYVQYLFFYWLEYYFEHVLHLERGQSRLFSSIASLSMAAGMVAGGWAADHLTRRLGRQRGRAAVPVAGMILSAVLVLLGAANGGAIPVLIYFSGAMAAIGATEGPFWVTAIELGGSRGGTSAAILNTGGNAGGLVAPMLTPLLGRLFGWQASIAVAGDFSLIRAELWAGIRPAEPAVESPTD